MNREQRGFTLIEVLIAMAITAVIALLAYTSLNTVIAGVESVRREADYTYQLNRAFQPWDAADDSAALRAFARLRSWARKPSAPLRPEPPSA